MQQRMSDESDIHTKDSIQIQAQSRIRVMHHLEYLFIFGSSHNSVTCKHICIFIDLEQTY